MHFFGAIIFFQIVLFIIFVAVTRWLFRVNHMVSLLESIDESLRTLPSVQQYDRSDERMANTKMGTVA